MISLTQPATGKIFHQISSDIIDTPQTIQSKLKAAQEAQPAWAATPLEARLAMIEEFRDLLTSRQEALAKTLTQEMGKPITQARNELQGTISRINFFLQNVSTIYNESIVSSSDARCLEKITRDPLGVVVNISAWNYPYFIGSNVWIPALLTGNAVLYKPSEFTILTGLEVQNLFHEAGVPKAVFSAVIGRGDIGSALIQLPIQGVFFTGSYATGRKILETLGPRQGLEVIRVQLELGGKDPVYVCDDVDVNSVAAAIADGAFYNAGQSCCSVERIYVHRKIYSQFIEAFVRTVKSFPMGDPMSSETYLGPITRESHLLFLKDQVSDALARGAKLLTGGSRIKRPGFYFEPTVLSEVNHSMKLMKEETFGPVVGIQSVENDQEALCLMNDTSYGLTASVFTPDQARAISLLSKVQSGTVYWNCCDRVSPRLPWSGRKHSGMGSTLSTYGIETFLQLKAWHLKV